MQGLRVGHFTDEQHKTGASVFLFEQPAVGAYWLCGSAPASHELDTLALDAYVTHMDGLALLGGSAFGLNAVAGVMRWCQEQGKGWPTPHGNVPIVPAAAIYDMQLKTPAYPSAEAVYEACRHATVGNKDSGCIGAGTGASVGKVLANASPMRGGIGRAEIQLANGVTVLAYAVVNSVGDVYDYEKIIAGAQLANGKFADCQRALQEGQVPQTDFGANTTLVAIFTDAAFSRVEMSRIAKMATAGMGRAIAPIFTQYDGDLIFSVSIGKKSAAELMIGAVAAEITRLAIIDAVKDSCAID